MSAVIDWLERLGRNARHASRTELESELVNLGIDAETRAALLNGDGPRLEELLGASTNVCCLVETPEDEKDQPSREPPGDQDDEQEDSDAGTSKVRLSATSRDATIQ